MKSAILILTYTSPKLTQKLVQKLNNGDFDFYIHVDKKSDLEPYKILLQEPHVYFVKERVDITWASYSSVVATLNALRQIRETGIQYDYISNITGQDYPIKSAEYITHFLEQHKGKQFMYYMDFDKWPGAQKRTEKYHLADMNIPGKFFVQAVLNFLVKKRKVPGGLKVYGSSTFWTLTQDCAMYMVKYMDDNPKVVHYLKYIFGSDEFAYQTIIMNSHYKDAVVNNNYRYVDWSQGGYRPKVLGAADLDKLVATDCLFGRKFNIDTDPEIIDLIDNHNAYNQPEIVNSP